MADIICQILREFNQYKRFFKLLHNVYHILEEFDILKIYLSDKNKFKADLHLDIHILKLQVFLVVKI